MVKELKNKSFTEVYKDNIIQIYSNADITRFSDTIDNSTQIFKELNLYYYSNNIRHILSRIVLKPNEELTKVICFRSPYNPKTIKKILIVWH